jgi:signal transduction histidine kinase/CheY-like chemotaxis protein
VPNDFEGLERVPKISGDAPPSREGALQRELDNLVEHWQAVALATGIGTVRWDVERELVQLDHAAATQFGVPDKFLYPLPQEEWLALIAPEDRLRAHALIDSDLREGTEELALRVGPGSKPRLLQLQMRAAKGGRLLVGASKDVTREHSMEEMRRQKLAAERANQAKSEFMSQVSHELRTPLNAILGFAELMAIDSADPLSELQQERLAVLRQSGQRLLGLIDQLLQIARIEKGKLNLRRKTVAVLPVIQRCTAALNVLAAQKGIEIELDAEGAEDMSVRADPDALEQVVTNLLSNAIKYNRDNGRVRVRMRAGKEGEITVDDTGKGLSDSQLGRLFEPFNRLAAEKSGVQGTGLGLVITRNLVSAMGGRLDVWSQVNKGSRFQVRLPLGRRVRMRDTHTMQLDMPSRWNHGDHYSVVYIEDDEVNAVLMEQLFSTQPDWHLEVVDTGEAGIAAAVRQRPRVILLDMNLPDMPGSEVFRRLKADPRTRDIPCVAVSADALPDSMRRALALGFDDYWTKPLELTPVIGKLKRLLRRAGE